MDYLDDARNEDLREDSTDRDMANAQIAYNFFEEIRAAEEGRTNDLATLKEQTQAMDPSAVYDLRGDREVPQVIIDKANDFLNDSRNEDKKDDGRDDDDDMRSEDLNSRDDDKDRDSEKDGRDLGREDNNVSSHDGSKDQAIGSMRGR